MTRWEYATISGSDPAAYTVLETMGAKGWEFCGQIDRLTTWLLKRPLPPPAPRQYQPVAPRMLLVPNADAPAEIARQQNLGYVLIEQHFRDHETELHFDKAKEPPRRTATEIGCLEAAERQQRTTKRLLDNLQRNINNADYTALRTAALRLLDYLSVYPGGADTLTQDAGGQEKPQAAPREVPQEGWRKLPEVPDKTGWVMVRRKGTRKHDNPVETEPAWFSTPPTDWPWVTWNGDGELILDPADILEWHPIPQ